MISNLLQVASINFLMGTSNDFLSVELVEVGRIDAVAIVYALDCHLSSLTRLSACHLVIFQSPTMASL